MKRVALYLGLATALVASCSTHEKDFQTPQQDDVVFYASFEQPAEDGTRVYANEDLLLRWTADDRVSIFGKNTFNQQYKFLGETGDSFGSFSKVDDAEYVTGNPISHTVSVYPFQASTMITEDEVITVTLPAEQHYAENSFGLGDNTMVSVSADNVLQFKSVSGYLMLKLYGEGVSVSSITLKGNNGEKLAGKASVTMPLDGVPTAVMDDDATSEITLSFETPVQLGTTAEESTQFWFVVPPVTFSKGFTITVSTSSDGSFEKSTDKTITIKRNHLSKMAPMEVVPVVKRKYLTFTSESMTKISLTNNNGNAPVLFYSTDKVNWTLWDYSELSFTSDQPIYIYGDNPLGFSSWEKNSSFKTSGNHFRVSGDIMCLLDSEHSWIAILDGWCFYQLFKDCTNLASAPDLPATTLEYQCYASMFENCTSLTSAPELPATTLADNCYNGMFRGCTSLSFAPDLPATTLEYGCYAHMFENCTSLITAPRLPATTLASGCYGSMFRGCTSLTTAPELSATTLASGCYSGMFYDCTGLTTAPELPAIILPDYCYQVMFSGCTSLTAAPALPATTLADNCYEGMFENCTSLTSAPKLPATILASNCYYTMFENCTSLTAAPELPVTALATSCYGGMFRGCTSLTAAPRLPATTLAPGCYLGMFRGCTSLKSAPELPATSLASGCYGSMFRGCTSLTSAPMLPATTLVSDCYNSMFWGCISLATAPELPATTLASGCYGGMFYDCTGLTTAPELLAATLAEYCYSGMFSGCEKLNYIKCLATSISATDCLDSWLRSVAATGTFIKATNMSEWPKGKSGIPEGWIVADNTSSPNPEAVDLGLPSGLKWASFNLGASKPEEYGDYYAWGETEPYYNSQDPLSWKEGKESGYAGASYRWCMGSDLKMTKYCSNSSFGYNGFTDTKTVLDPEDDAAHVNLGGNWRMPTDAEWTELREKCTWTWTTQNGVYGRLVTASNGNSIFLPAAGNRIVTYLNDAGSYGYFWSSSLNTDSSNNAWFVNFYSGNVYRYYDGYRCDGFSIRPVCD